MRWFAWIWGFGGVMALLAKAVWGLTPLCLDAAAMEWTWAHWAFAVPWIAFMAYAEGYKGFQKGFSPRVVSRTVHLFEHPRPLHLALAPAYAMCLLHATRKRLIVGWCLVIGVAVLVVLVGLLPQPWRGIVDMGVVIGLSWGTASLVWFAVLAARGAELVDPALPTPPAAPAAGASGSPG